MHIIYEVAVFKVEQHHYHPHPHHHHQLLDIAERVLQPEVYNTSGGVASNQSAARDPWQSG